MRILPEGTSLKSLDFRRFTRYLVLAFLLVVVPFYNPLFSVVGSLDVSLPYRFFLRTSLIKSIEKGSYVEIDVSGRRFPELLKGKKVRFLIKRVVCTEGDLLEYREGSFYCNGVFIGRVHPDSPSPPFRYSGRVPGGHFFAVGTHPRSYDSRYMGFFRREEVTGRVYPLF